jgi:hypothetical protein
MLWNSIAKKKIKNLLKLSGNHNMIKRYYSMLNCNQNYHRYNKYYVLIMATKTWYPNK